MGEGRVTEHVLSEYVLGSGFREAMGMGWSGRCAPRLGGDECSGSWIWYTSVKLAPGKRFAVTELVKLYVF